MDIKWHSHGDWARSGKEDPGEDWTDDSSLSDSDGSPSVRLSVCLCRQPFYDGERAKWRRRLQGNRFKPGSRERVTKVKTSKPQFPC